jgi:hypothetical protein
VRNTLRARSSENALKTRGNLSRLEDAPTLARDPRALDARTGFDSTISRRENSGYEADGNGSVEPKPSEPALPRRHVYAIRLGL